MNATMRLARRITVLVAAMAVPLAVSCSLPADEQVTPIDADELGDLADPTTTTTTVPPTTQPPGSTVAEPSTTTSTTVVQLPRESLRLFYTVGTSDDMRRVVLDYPSPIELQDVVQALESPLAEVTAAGWRTAVRRNLVVDYQLDRATLNVQLDGGLFNAMTEEQRRRAIGQMVLTFTSFTPPDTGSIGFVAFFVDGAPISVFVPSLQSSSEAGEPVAYEDFDPLLGGTPVAPATAPPTSQPTATSAPPTTAPA